MILNPYSGVDWSKQQKANLHTHTKLTTIDSVVYGSDGALTAAEVIDTYYGKGYKILAITDHDNSEYSQVTTWPWTVFGRNPETLGMLAIQGKELSRGNHILSLFNSLGVSETDDEALSLRRIKDNNGIAIIAHPGRYDESVNWYVLLLTGIAGVCGLEVYNQGDKYNTDRQLWDLVNAITIPAGKIVWGFSNDDMHNAAHKFRNYQFVLSDLAESAVKMALLNGHTYFCYEPSGTGEAETPRISNIVVDSGAKTISITADSGTISWITEGTTEVGTGSTFDYSSIETSFVRAEITNDFGVTCTQPFAVLDDDNPLNTIRSVTKSFYKVDETTLKSVTKYIVKTDESNLKEATSIKIKV